MWFIVYYNLITGAQVAIPTDNHQGCLSIKFDLYPVVYQTQVIPHCEYRNFK